MYSRRVRACACVLVHACVCLWVYTCIWAIVYVHVRTCLCVLHACACILVHLCTCACACARVRAFDAVAGVWRGCVCLHAHVRVVGVHASARPCERMWVCVFSRVLNNPGFWRLGKYKIFANNSVTNQNKVKLFLRINYIPKSFFWYFNLLYTFYGISIILICQ